MYDRVIKKLMIKHSFYTAYELAKESGVTAMGISNILNGFVVTPRRTTLKKLSTAFGISVREIRELAQKEEGINR
jgi:transcriptional regulator with XRE-family HTH domain